MKRTMKIVTINFIGGRVGSSLTTGILEKSGMSAGNVSRSADQFNPKGYFEVVEYLKYLRSLFPETSRFMPPVFTHEEALEYIESSAKDFPSRFHEWFGGTKELVVKCPYYHPSLLFERFIYDAKVIRIALTRDVSNHVASMKRMNTKFASDDEWKRWVHAWDERASSEYSCELTIPFESWFDAPLLTYRELYDVVKPPKELTEKEINDWINKEYRNFK